MPPKGTKSPRTKSPKTAKAAGATWEASMTATSVNEVSNTKMLLVNSFFSFYSIG